MNCLRSRKGGPQSSVSSGKKKLHFRVKHEREGLFTVFFTIMTNLKPDCPLKFKMRVGRTQVFLLSWSRHQTGGASAELLSSNVAL